MYFPFIYLNKFIFSFALDGHSQRKYFVIRRLEYFKLCVCISCVLDGSKQIGKHFLCVSTINMENKYLPRQILWVFVAWLVSVCSNTDSQQVVDQTLAGFYLVKYYYIRKGFLSFKLHRYHVCYVVILKGFCHVGQTFHMS